MTQPPSSESGNVVDPAVLSARRARRAEVTEDASLELRLFEAERRLGEVAAERDALRLKVAEFERDLRGGRQREWAEQQQRLEAQGEAAAARELAGVQLAELRERLSEAEAEVATVAAERDRARKALEDERLRATAERERREALEREGLLLRAEIARRDDEGVSLRAELSRREDLTSAAAEAVAAARHALAARSDVSSDLEARVAAERREFAARVVAVERAVVAVRERLGAAARVLRERLEAERTARVSAEAALGAERTARLAAETAADGARLRAAELEREHARAGELEQAVVAARSRTDELERELRRRGEVEAQLRAALDALHAELAAVRAGGDERVARLSQRVESVVMLATKLRGEANSEQQSLASSLEEMRARVAELQAQSAAETTELREQLDAERAARWVAEAELDAERRRGDEDRAARASAEAELASLRALDRPSAPDPSTLASLREALSHFQAPSEAAPSETPSLSLDLTAAAARLRAASAEAEPEPFAVAEPPHVAPAVEPAAVVEPLDVASPAEPTAEPEAEAFAPQPLQARKPVDAPGPWLRDALRGLAADEPEIAELVLVSLLPAQGGLSRGTLTYELAVDAGTTNRVVVEADKARVALGRGEEPDARVSGPLAALVPLVAGGAGRRLPGARVQGRWQLRRLLKARRRPLGLAELAAAGVAPSPGLLLTVLARAVDPSWIAGRALQVEVAATGADAWRVVSTGTGALKILPAEGAPPADATLHTSASRLPAVLAGTATPADASYSGDLRQLRTLLSWLDRAQREPR